MRRIPLACLLLTALLIPGPADSRQAKGALVEVLTQSNEVVRLELQEIAPSPRSGSLLLTKELAPAAEQIAWYDIPLGPKTKETGRLREIRLFEEPRKLESGGRQFLLHPVVVITGDETEGRSANWLWVGEQLSGISRSPGARSRRISIPISNIKVVRFPKP
jgi:hypothetical protein